MKEEAEVQEYFTQGVFFSSLLFKLHHLLRHPRFARNLAYIPNSSLTILSELSTRQPLRQMILHPSKIL